MYQNAPTNYSNGETNYNSGPSLDSFLERYSKPEQHYDPDAPAKLGVKDHSTTESLGSQYSIPGVGGLPSMEQTPSINVIINYGPLMIGGGSYSLGSSNNSYSCDFNGGDKSYSGNFDALLQDSIIDTLKNTYLTNKSQLDFTAGDFLSVHRPITQFIGEVEEIKKYVEQAFREVTGEDLPENLRLHVLNEEEFLKAHGKHGGNFSEGIMGFSLNSQGLGFNEVFVKQDNFDRLMLTMGHEIGHVMSKSLPNQQDEEAKAFAFSIAWMEKIIEKNIGNLSQCLHPRPAENGLHNVAFNFVSKQLQEKGAFELFKELVNEELTITYGG